MKFFAYFLILISTISMAFACDSGCTANATSIRLSLEAVVTSCNQLQNWQQSGQDIEQSIDGVTSALANVVSEVELFAGKLTQAEVQIIVQALVDVQAALKASLDVVIDLDINILGLIDLHLDIDLDLVANLVVQLYVQVDAVVDAIIGICPASAQPKVIPTCNKIKQTVQKCCSQFDQTCQ